MTVRVERAFEVAAPPETVWEFIVDPERRARSISVVSDFTLEDEAGRRATWEVDLPIPLVRKTVTVDTEDVVRRPAEYVEFVGNSKAFTVRGEHELTETETGTRLENRFTVDGRLPGVEHFFERRFDDELENLGEELRRYLREER